MKRNYQVGDFVFYYDKDGATIPGRVLKVTKEKLKITVDNISSLYVSKSKCILQEDHF